MERISIGGTEIRLAIGMLLTHPAFAKSKKLSAFLSYIVQESLAGRGHLLKAYTVATQALGRGSDFDPATDAIVRVEARRLRLALRTIYEEPGCALRVHVELPLGGYDPVFRRMPLAPPSRAGIGPIRDDLLHESEQRYLARMRASAVVEWRADPDGVVTWSLGWTERTGQEPEVFAGQGWLDAVHPADRGRTLDVWTAARRAREPVEVAFRVLHQDGGYRWMLSRGVPIEDPDGSIRAWVGTMIERPAPAEVAPFGHPVRPADGLASARRLGAIYEILRNGQAEESEAMARREAEVRRLATNLGRSGLTIGAPVPFSWHLPAEPNC